MSRKQRQPPAVPVVSPQPPPPTKREQAAIDRATKRYRARPAVAEVALTRNGDRLVVGPQHSDVTGFTAMILEAFGTESVAVLDMMMAQLSRAATPPGAKEPDERRLNALIAVVHAAAPENELEAMLVVQMATVHDLAMEMAARSKKTEFVQTLQDCGGLTVRLMRTFAIQAEALAKLRRGGEQRVTVKHVHVHAGGQAIVGAVTAGGGGTEKNEDQPHAIENGGEPAGLWSADAGRDAVPIPADAERPL